MSIVLKEHKINKNTNKCSFGTCNECAYRKTCANRRNTDNAVTVRCTSFALK